MGTEKSRVTIADVAVAAGVSKTTVSRYLNGKFEFMSEESKEKIAAVISRLHYRPNNLARGLKSSKSKLIGVVIADIANPFSSILLKGIGDCCKQYGYNVMSAFTDNDPEREKECILSLVDQQVEGLIINTTCQNNEFLEQIALKYVPIVLADRPIFPTRFDTVRTNDYPVTLETLRYLAQQGYRRVGFFSEPVQEIGTRVLRLSAYHEACRTGVIEEPQEYILSQEDNLQADIELVQSFMTRNAEAKRAIFTANGVAMLRVLEAIENLNLTMPDDLGCCGFDNWRWTRLIKPGITAISQPSYEVGVECVKRMMLRIQGSKAAPQMIELVNELVIRGSV